jgi:hypothetical protein
MKNKSRKPVQGILKTGVLVPITDPAEQAALDRRIREAEKAMAEREMIPRKAKSRKGK